MDSHRRTISSVAFLAGAAVGSGATWATRRYFTNRQPFEEGLADRIGWAVLIGDGVILMQDGTFLTGFTFRERDLESASDEALNHGSSPLDSAAKWGSEEGFGVFLRRLLL